MVRSSYRRELLAAFTLPVTLALVEGGVIGIFAKKMYHVSDFQLATIVAAPMFGNFTSVIWTQIFHGRSKSASVAILLTLFILTVIAIGLLPVGQAYAGVLTLLVVLSRCLIAGLVTLRSQVWRLNYSRVIRGRITSRFTLVTMLFMSSMALGSAAMLDWRPNSFWMVYLIGASLGVVGVFAYAGLRVRQEKSVLRFERRDQAALRRENLYLDNAHSGWFSTASSAIEVLKTDKKFRMYMLWQFVAGMSNMMASTAVIDLIAYETTRLKHWGVLQNDKFVAVLLSVAISYLLIVISVPYWAKLLDRMHITRFRMIQGPFWVLWELLVMASVFLIQMAHGPEHSHLLVWAMIGIGIAMFFRGISFGAGNLAWNLGHNDFAKKELVPVYMNIHLMLTGIRGMTAPYLGIFLYVVAGPWFFGYAAVLALLSTIGYWCMYRQLKRDGEVSVASIED